MDDIMTSHVNPKVDDRFKEWMNRNYGNHIEVKDTSTLEWPLILQKKER